MIGLFLRAYLHVLLVAANVTHIATGRYEWAFATGFLISFVWWINTRSANRLEGSLSHFVYSLGAGLGTVSGMLLGRL